MKEIDKAWVAGIIDGEGALILTRFKPTKKNGRKTVGYQIRVSVGNNDRTIIDRLRALYPGYLYINKKGTVNNYSKFCWNLSAWKAAEFLKEIFSYLVSERKRKLAKLLVQFQEDQTNYNRKKLRWKDGLCKSRIPDEEVKRREEVWNVIHSLQEKGKR